MGIKIQPKEFLNRVNKDIEVLGSYTLMKDYIKVRCKKCNRTWESKASYLSNGYSCDVCSRKEQGKKRTKTLEQFIEDNKGKFNKNVEIIGDYIDTRTKVTVRCKVCNHEWDMKPTNLTKGRGCPKCAHTYSMSFDEFINKLKTVNSNIKVIEKDYKNLSTPILVECLIDGYQWKAAPKTLLRGYGCSVCAKHALLVGYNDIETKAPWMVSYLKNKNDKNGYTYCSNQRIWFKCNNCGFEEPQIVSNIYKYGHYHCRCCSDNISYPNKIGRSFLRQLPINNFIVEYSPKWAMGKRYDNYFEYNNKQYILEMDGGWHFKNNNLSNKSVEAQKEIDEYKDLLAINNGIEVIRIECIESDINYIKNNIINSKLSKIFDLNNIDWDKCINYSMTNLVKDVADLYNQHKYSNKEIADKLLIPLSTVYYYTRKGRKYGFIL